MRETVRVLYLLYFEIGRTFIQETFMASKTNESEKNRPVIICYNAPAAAVVCHQQYDKKREIALKGSLKTKLTVPRRSARAWVVKKNELCRITVSEGSQVCYCFN